MADSTISALPSVTAVNDADVLVLVQGGVSSKTTIGRLNRKVMNQSIANQSPTAAALTLITGSTIAMPTGVLPNVNTLVQWKMIVAKTAAGTAASVFHIRYGTTGTTSDPAICTFTLGAGTAVADTGRIDTMLSFRSVGTGTSAVAQGSLVLTHNLAATGLLTVPSNNIAVTSSGFASSVANSIFSMSVTSGASVALTFSQVISEAVNV